MKIIACTKNRAKVAAVKNIFTELFEDVEVHDESFPSDISEQPLSEEEGIDGAINRAKNAFAVHQDADFCVGLEGYVDTNKHGMFLAGAVAILDPSGQIGVGISGKVRLPELIKKEVDGGMELGPLVQELFKDTENEIRHSQGTCGMLSGGLYTRVHEFEDAIKLALSPFRSPEYYK